MRRYLLAGVVLSAAATFSGSASADSYGLGRTCPQVWENWPYIQAVCYNAFGGLVRSRIDARRCGGNTITNINGNLACGGPARRPPPPGWGGGHGRPPGPPPGYGPPPGHPPGWGGGWR